MAKEGTTFSKQTEPKFARYFCALLALLFVFNIRAERLPVKIFTSADGLGSSFISHLLRDSRGFLWFATRDGLSRFDGSHFVTYQVGERDAPPGIEHIIETRKGIYWIATTGGIYRFDPQKINPKISDRSILNAEFVSERRGSFYEDKAGRLWLFGRGLYLVEEAADGKILLNKIELNFPENPAMLFTIVAVAEARDGSFWIASSWGVMRRLPSGREIIYRLESTRTNFLTALLEDSAGRIWLARSSGIYVIKPDLSEPPAVAGGSMNAANPPATAGGSDFRNLEALALIHTEKQIRLPETAGEIYKFTAAEGFADSTSKFLYESRDGHVWISTLKGVVEFDGQNFHSYTAAQGVLGGAGKMVEDAGGNLWLGGANGLMRLNRNGLISYDAADGLENPRILVINQSRGGEIYTASGDFHVSRFDGVKFKTVQPPLPDDARSLWFSNPVYLDSRNDWWFLTNEKLYRFAASGDFKSLAGQRPLASYTTRDGLKGDMMFHVFEDRQGEIWISNRAASSEQFGLSKFNRATEKFYTFSENENFPPNKSVSAFAEDSQGNLWVGFYEGGLMSFRRDGRFTEIDDDLPAGVVTALHFDKTGRLWIASALGGVCRIDESGGESPRFTHFTTENGLSSNNVRSMTEDNFGQIYVGTARGVDRIAPETGQIKHYSTEDGLLGDFVTVAFHDQSGALWFATSNGVSRLVSRTEEKSIAPPVWLSGLRIAGENQPIAELGSREISSLELAPAQNNLQIDFFGIDFSPNESLRYQFMLEGADTDWSPPSEQRTVNFSNLSAGDYRFLVRAVNADGIHTPQPAVVSFKLLPPVWRRWWFVASIILLVGAGVFALDRFRVKKTRQVERALTTTRESETRYRTLTETASDAIITIDETSRIVYVNEAVEIVFGYAPEELIGENLTKLMPERFRSQHENGFGRYLETRRKNLTWAAIELPGEHKSGAEIPLELSFGEFEKDSRRYFTGIARDISERKKSEAALQKSREERFAELERVRSRIARDLHDDVGSSLTQIALFSEVAKQKQNGNAEAAAPLEFLVETSNELVEAMSDIVWAINPNKDHLLDLTQRMRRFAAEVLTVAEIDLEFFAPEADTRMGANLRREVFLIFKESINNIVKHSGADKARIDFHLENDRLVLRLADDGRGFDVAEVNDASENFDWQKARGGNGLLSMRRRAEELGGEFSVDTGFGKGTIVTLRVPLGENSKILS